MTEPANRPQPTLEQATQEAIRHFANFLAAIAESAKEIAAPFQPRPESAGSTLPPRPYGQVPAVKRYTARELMDRMNAAEKEAAYERMRANDLAEQVKALKRACDALGKQVNDAADTTASDGAWHTVWLEGNWKWTTRKMTTAQREHAAAAVERYSAEQGDPDDDPINVRWWDE